MPWIYSKERPEVHETSTYNRRPKGLTTYYANKETKLATIRKNLELQEGKLLKLRTDRRANRVGTQEEQLFLSVWKGLHAAQTAEKYVKNVSKSKERAAKKAED